MRTPSLKNLRKAHEVSFPGDFLSITRDVETGDLFVGTTLGKIYRIVNPDLGREDPFPRVIDAHVSFVSGLVIVGDTLISAGSDYKVVWWNRKTHTKVREVVHPKWVRYLALSPDGALLASACDDMVARIFDARSGKLVHELRGGHDVFTEFYFPSKLYTCVFSPDGKHLATADQAGRIVVWEVSSGKEVARMKAFYLYRYDVNGHSYGGIRSIDFSPDGVLLAAGGNIAGDTSVANGQSSIVIYDWKKGEQTHDLREGGKFFFERVKFHHEGAWLLGAAGAGAGHKLVFFDLETKKIAHQVESGMLTFDLVMSGQSDTIYAAGRRGNSTVDTKGTLIRWDMTRRLRKV